MEKIKTLDHVTEQTYMVLNNFNHLYYCRKIIRIIRLEG